MTQRELKDMPAGVADDYTEKVKAMRQKESAKGIRPVKHVRQVMVEYIENLQEGIKKNR